MTHHVNLGRTVITPAALCEIDSRDLDQAMARHASGDWGEVCPEDRQANEDAIRNGERLLSVYRDRYDKKFWIITEADRSSTTVLMPEDY